MWSNPARRFEMGFGDSGRIWREVHVLGPWGKCMWRSDLLGSVDRVGVVWHGRITKVLVSNVST